MQTASLFFQLAPGQNLPVVLPAPAEVEMILRAAQHFGREKARLAELRQTYHMGAKPTEGLDYDDRLPIRLKCHPDTAYQYLGLPIDQGGIRNKRLGKKIIVTEWAVKEFLGDPVNPEENPN